MAMAVFPGKNGALRLLPRKCLLEPLANRTAFERIAGELDHTILEPVYETVRLVKGALAPDVTLLGFCGAPWTVATYMIAGHGTPDQAPARQFGYRDRVGLEEAEVDRSVAVTHQVGFEVALPGQGGVSGIRRIDRLRGHSRPPGGKHESPGGHGIPSSAAAYSGVEDCRS